MTTPDSARSARRNMRISPEALSLLKAAAAEQHQDLTAFVLGAAIERARGILIEHHVLQLSPQAVAQLDKALSESPVPSSAEAFVRHLHDAVTEAMSDTALSRHAAANVEMLRT